MDSWGVFITYSDFLGEINIKFLHKISQPCQSITRQEMGCDVTFYKFSAICGPT